MHFIVLLCSLQKDHRGRPNYTELLTYPFIVNNKDNDIKPFVQEILGPASPETGTPLSS